MNNIAPTPSPQFNTAATTEYQPANNNKRVIAFIIDSLISAALSKIIFLVFYKFLHLNATSQLVLNLFLGFIILPMLYWVCLTVLLGATPGKKMMGLRIVTNTYSTELSIPQLILRETIGRIISLLPLFLGYVWVSFNSDRKTFHDMIASTRVVDYK